MRVVSATTVTPSNGIRFGRHREKEPALLLHSPMRRRLLAPLLLVFIVVYVYLIYITDRSLMDEMGGSKSPVSNDKGRVGKELLDDIKELKDKVAQQQKVFDVLGISGFLVAIQAKAWCCEEKEGNNYLDSAVTNRIVTKAGRLCLRITSGAHSTARVLSYQIVQGSVNKLSSDQSLVQDDAVISSELRPGELSLIVCQIFNQVVIKTITFSIGATITCCHS